MGQQKEVAAQYVGRLISVLTDTMTSKSDQYQQPSQYVFKRIWQRVQEVSVIQARDLLTRANVMTGPECTPGNSDSSYPYNTSRQKGREKTTLRKRPLKREN
jgi:hypothetical protein